MIIGVLAGEGVGPEVVPVALSLLEALTRDGRRPFQIRYGGAIGQESTKICGKSLSDEIIQFIRDIFAEGGALFCGPGGDRFVYELRKEFSLFCKFTPIQPFPELSRTGPLRPEIVEGVDILAVREGLGGLYQGDWQRGADPREGQWASQTLRYTEEMVRNILGVAIEAAQGRRNQLHVVLKPGGAPAISSLWRECTQEMAAAAGVRWVELEIDNAAYQIAAHPRQFDVIVSPNMFGDVLADCGSVALASRGLSFSANFNLCGHGVYQTGHGAARDIAGQGVANPVGQILSLGMMLRESFGWPGADAALRTAVRAALRDGLSTADIPLPGGTILSTNDFGEAVRQRLPT